jgi:predicted Zn-dependent protease
MRVSSKPLAWLILVGLLWSIQSAAAPIDRPATAQEQHELDSSAKDLEIHIDRSGRLYAHAELDAYLQTIADRLLAADGTANGDSVRVRAVRDSSANAFALPNGAVFVTTGLLQRLDSEAQIASVLGHEITHYTNRHALKEMRTVKRKTNWGRGLTILLAAATGASPAQLSQNLTDLWVLTSVSGYEKDLEREADREGIRKLAAAGYDTAEGITVFERLLVAAKDEGGQEQPYFASHPRLEERLASYRELVAGEFAGATGAGRQIGADEYRAHVRGLALDQAEILLAEDELDRAGAIIDSELATGASARAYFLQGEVARARPKTPESQAAALAAYERAIAMPDAPPEAYRRKAMILRERGEDAAAVEAFKRYLELAPTAVDAPLVRLYLEDQATKAPPAPSKGESQ